MIKDIQPGQNIDGLDVIVLDNKGFTFKEKSVLKYVFSDGQGTIEYVDWNKTAAEAQLPEGMVVRISGLAEDYKGKLQIKGLRVERSTRSPAEFRTKSMFSTDALWSRYVNLVARLKDPMLKAIGEELLLGDSLLKLAPAGRSVHNNWLGGLLEHSLQMADIATGLMPLYRTYFPQLNEDLVLFGCLFHDFGKIYEYNVNHPAYEMTFEGELIGHIVIGCNEIYTIAMDIRTRADEQIQNSEPVSVPYSDEMLTKALHMIASHHGRLEYGSPVEPKMIEAIILHQVDMLDTRVMHAYGMMKGLPKTALFSDKSYFDKVRFLNQETRTEFVKPEFVAPAAAPTIDMSAPVMEPVFAPEPPPGAFNPDEEAEEPDDIDATDVDPTQPPF